VFSESLERRSNKFELLGKENLRMIASGRFFATPENHVKVPAASWYLPIVT
jgi:hypothetical protein